ncbi:hypothetical protein [Psychromicrobium lacuslunae]|uniref:hypothetical protein n=1 Tax=Psychromicrobium lacuslunae TaxID=1618207 RepID=UPI0006964524|nr:hypothetical protein [Psychromicrobium lacuslunae]
MTLFSKLFSARRDEVELGQGLWRRAHDRFRRGLDRFHQMLERIDDESLQQDLIPIANNLAELLPVVRAVCVSAQRLSPSAGLDVPAGAFNEIHRELTRAGTALATAAEAVAMARLDASSASVEATWRRAVQVEAHIELAKKLSLLTESNC